jgi:phosphohistidine phosphatase
MRRQEGFIEIRRARILTKMAGVRVLIVRHGQAVPQGAPGVADTDRPLTADGERRFRAAARTIARLQRTPDALLTSPLVRARQTAGLLASAWGDIAPTAERALAEGGVDAIVEVLARQPRDATVALVGHEPTVSSLVIEFLGVMSSEALTFAVGTAALLDVASPFRRSARLVWFLPADLAEALEIRREGGAQ